MSFNAPSSAIGNCSAAQEEVFGVWIFQRELFQRAVRKDLFHLFRTPRGLSELETANGRQHPDPAHVQREQGQDGDLAVNALVDATPISGPAWI